VKLRVTVDTNVLDADKRATIERAAKGLDIEIANTTVTERELEPSSITPISSAPAIKEGGVWGEGRWGGRTMWHSSPVVETLTLDESRLGKAVLASDETAARFETILRIISSGAFPKLGQRESLTYPQRRQLRDSMILEAHAREERDVFVTDDAKAFVGQAEGRNRQALETICKTRIMTVEEFCGYLVDLPRPAGRWARARSTFWVALKRCRETIAGWARLTP
jgi:hypothetical protein